MSDATIIFFLSICIGLLVCVVLYQQFVFRKGTEAKMRAISNKLKEIIETDSDERIMLFTENKELMELAAQINDLLEKHLKTKADYRRSEIASKKMLSNISHDIKTPMTVILGYLEIMQLSETPSKEMLKKVERKAQSVMELINQFFTLSKIESGDMEIELSRIDICEICRESILDFYELLSNKSFQVEVDIPETSVYIQGNKVGIPEGTIHTWLKAVRAGKLDIGEGSHTPTSAMSLAEEITMLRKRVKEQDKEIRRLKEENEFLEEASAFFAASRRKSAKTRE